MNKEDFRRNFAQSYFGLQPSLIKKSVSASVWDSLDLTTSNPLVPCTTPVFGSTSMQVSALLRSEDGTYFSTPIILEWKEDMDEDSSVMQAQHPARLGMVQAGDTAVFVRRYPHRQYNRGYAPRSCHVWTPNRHTFPDTRGEIVSNSHAVVWSIFNPYVKSLDEALTLLETGDKIGVVLGPWLAVVVEHGKKYPRLVYRTDYIGFIQNRDPVVYEDSSEVARDYVYKITGKYPKVK